MNYLSLSLSLLPILLVLILLTTNLPPGLMIKALGERGAQVFYRKTLNREAVSNILQKNTRKLTPIIDQIQGGELCG